jgi:hypothetical protein
MKGNKMKRYKIQGKMRKDNAIGIFYYNVVIILANNENEAWDEFNNNWETINYKPTITEVIK